MIPGPGVSLPANAPALVFQPARLPSMRSIENYAIELRGPTGELVPHSVIADGDAYLVRFGAPLSPGPMQITYVDFCSLVAGTRLSRIVDIGPAVALPTSLGTVTVSAQARLLGDPCTLPADVDATVEVHPSAEMAPFLAVARWTVTYGGERMVGYGGLPGPRYLFSIQGTCASAQDVLTGQVTIAAHLAGTDVDPAAASADVMVRCAISELSKPPATCVPGSTPNPDAAAGVDAGVGPDDDAGTAVPRGRHSGAGCSTGGQGASPFAVLGVLTALGAAWPRQRRLGANRRSPSSCDR